MCTEEPLFPASLIAANITASLPQGYTIRPLERGDYAKGFLDCLAVLVEVGDVSLARFEERYNWMMTQGQGVHYYVVIEHEDRVVGTGAITIERRFTRNLSTVGHISDVAIDKKHQRKGLGLKVMASLASIAESAGCWKAILATKNYNKAFYARCGYYVDDSRVMTLQIKKL